MWQLHLFKCYSVSTAYHFLASINHDIQTVNSDVLWHKVVPLKVNLFFWRLLLNHIPTKDNLLWRSVIQNNDKQCMGRCRVNEDVDHLFIRCDFFLGRMWSLISNWIGFVIVHLGSLSDLMHFGCLSSLSKQASMALSIIWLSYEWVIWKERNMHIFGTRRIICKCYVTKLRCSLFDDWKRVTQLS